MLAKPLIPASIIKEHVGFSLQLNACNQRIVDLDFAAADNELPCAAQLRFKMYRPCRSWRLRSLPFLKSRMRTFSLT
jgi:hypothetical protein